MPRLVNTCASLGIAYSPWREFRHVGLRTGQPAPLVRVATFCEVLLIIGEPAPQNLDHPLTFQAEERDQLVLKLGGLDQEECSYIRISRYRIQ